MGSPPARTKSGKRPRDTITSRTYKGHQVHKGKQGGLFVMSRGKRVYLSAYTRTRKPYSSKRPMGLHAFGY